jgi:hypothetical protein
LGAVKHTVSVVKALFMKNDKHAWGYDTWEPIATEDHNGKTGEFNPEEKYDRLSVESTQVGLVDFHYQGVDGKKLFFKIKDASICEVKPKDAGKNPIVLEIRAKELIFGETLVEARLGSLSGPIAAVIGVTVLKSAVYEANYIRVVDPDSQKTRLKINATPAIIQNALNRFYKSGVSTWKIGGPGKDIQCKYDIRRNGVLDLEPGVESEELKKINEVCTSKVLPIIHVHDLRWSFYLAADAGPKDTRINLKQYGEYLDYIGLNSYLLEDRNGKSTVIHVKAIHHATAEIELTGPLGIELKVSDKSALIWPLGGLSGNPTLITDVGSLDTLLIFAAHELGHSHAGFYDIAEVDNIMFGGASTGKNLRGRRLPMFYYPGRMESQWSQLAKKR